MPARDDRSSRLADHGEAELPADHWLTAQLGSCPLTRLPIDALLPADSPRQGGTSHSHAELLAEVEGTLPPIVVHGPTMRVVDGMHRVRAAQARGQRDIAAKVYDGTERDAFVIAVKLNVQHGLPLGRAERVAAAERIVDSHPDWSNRMIASATGLSPSTVAQIRKRSSDSIDQLDARRGQDGRVRPLNSAAGRLLAGKLLAERPEASLRAVAREAGVSPSTVQDVRQRLRAGEHPLRDRQRIGTGGAGAVRPEPSRELQPQFVSDPVGRLADLKNDPALRFRDTGRVLLRWLDVHIGGMAHWDDIVHKVPEHLVGTVADLARSHAQAWSRFAEHLERRAIDDGRRARSSESDVGPVEKR
ncbi:ParB/RepB/Spo0J family partition protein [Amycolatopsis pithecellobii]|uniref:Streptomycin biosynthesis protein n=1 Tax=Amycolatopsis pithecellobii TaxID=664692 RepID=A0A6N7Z522_9PSEU|nr:ParB N-terminal domain-containing protein [Amycolatopsis pithecellobii]MTD55584.1 streptomycin biosynthesis protein [Amycolatopsis pithecellobii]